MDGKKIGLIIAVVVIIIIQIIAIVISEKNGPKIKEQMSSSMAIEHVIEMPDFGLNI